MTAPAVSVVVVTYGGEEHVRRTLESLRAHTPEPHELIVVDNASPDGTAALLRGEAEGTPGVTVVFNDDNAGFGPAANQGAALAAAPFLCFLNSDAFVHAGWLAPLLAACQQAPDVAAAVPRFLHPDGALQEAGCVISRDGRTVSLGFDDAPESPWNLFPRDIPYGSAACMVIRRDVFESAAGFDPAFAPAYYEDVDLCFRLRERDWRIRYEPASVVTHMRGASSRSEWAEQLIERHRALFLDRWGERLQRAPLLVGLPAYSHRFVAARDLDVTARILVVTGEVPDPDTFGLPVPPGARVTLAAPHGDPGPVAGWLRRGVEVAVPPVDWQRFFRRRLFHYDTVVTADGASVPGVEDTQPQAARVSLEGVLSGGRLPV